MSEAVLRCVLCTYSYFVTTPFWRAMGVINRWTFYSWLLHCLPDRHATLAAPSGSTRARYAEEHAPANPKRQLFFGRVHFSRAQPALALCRAVVNCAVFRKEARLHHHPSPSWRFSIVERCCPTHLTSPLFPIISLLVEGRLSRARHHASSTHRDRILTLSLCSAVATPLPLLIRSKSKITFHYFVLPRHYERSHHWI